MNLLQRVVGVFVSPGKVFDWLAREPRWGGALLLGMLFAVVAQLLIPMDMQIQALRGIFIERGIEFTDADLERAASMGRVFGPVSSAVFAAVLTLVLAGFATFLFAFLMGDEGSFKQYLAATSHALLIPLLGSVAITPLRILSGDPQMVISPGSVVGDALGDGFLSGFLGYIDLFAVWGMAVLAIGIAKIDPKRDFATAFAVLFGFQLVIAAVLALLI